MPVMNQKEVRHYEKTRYSKPDQWFVNLLEQGIVGSIIKRYKLLKNSMLDIPCGFGRFSPLFLRNKIKLISADLSHAMVSRTRENLSHVEGNKNFIVASVKELPFKDNSFDVTFTVRLLHHNFTRDDRVKILKELNRVSKRFVIVTMYRTNLFHRLTRKLRRLKRVIVMLSMKEIEDEIRQSGLRIVERRILLPLFHSQVFFLLEKL